MLDEAMLEALSKRVYNSLDQEALLSNIPIASTDRAVKTMLDAMKGVPESPKGSILERISTWAFEQAKAVYPDEPKKKSR